MSEAEQATIAAILRDPSVLHSLSCREDDFHDPWLALAFRACKTLGSAADPVTVANKLNAQTKMEGGWQAYIGGLLDGLGSPENAEHYASVVRAQAVQRGYEAAARRALDTQDWPRLIRDLMHLERDVTSHDTDMLQGVRGFVDDLDRWQSGDTGVPTGLRSVSREFGNLQDTHLIILAARPKMGKTAMALTWAINAALAGYNVGFLSAEMSTNQLVARIVANRTHTSLHRMVRGELSDSECDTVRNRVATVAKLPIMVYDKPGMAAADCLMQARRWKHQGKLDLVIVDYLQFLARDGGTDQDWLKVGCDAKTLKGLAKELCVPCVALSQCNRAVEQRDVDHNGFGRQPSKSDLSQSGQLEQDADQIYTLDRPVVHLMDQQNDDPAHAQAIRRMQDKAFLRMAANRHGPTGTVGLRYSAGTLTFEDL